MSSGSNPSDAGPQGIRPAGMANAPSKNLAKADLGKVWVLAIGVALVAVTWAVYAGALSAEFVNFDDHLYVYQNSHVAAGLTPSSLAYAWTTFDSGNWIPATWMSYELDAALFGVQARAFHRTNILLHTLNVLLIFVVLRTMTQETPCSAIVALLFAVHPLHVESVAWVSERKDVLSTTGLLLSLPAYEYYARQPSLQRYFLVAAAMLFGLLAKPMIVTLPILLLLLDVWPLHRVSWPLSDATLTPADFRYAPRSWKSLILEKVPLLGLSLIDGLITIQAQASTPALTSGGAIPFGFRIANALQAYCWYLQKTFVPTGLCVFYKHPRSGIEWSSVIGSAAILVSVTLFVVYGPVLDRVNGGRPSQAVRERTMRIAGWGWFVISLLPVIGLLQVGIQAYADRYSYIPHLGLFVLLVWQAQAWLTAWRIPSMFGLVVVAAIAIFLSVRTVQQVSVWRDSDSLWARVLAYDPDSSLAHTALAQVRVEQNRLDEAERELQSAFATGALNAPKPVMVLGLLYERREEWRSATECYRWVIRMMSSYAKDEDKQQAEARLAELERKYPELVAPPVASRPTHPLIKQGMAAVRRGDFAEAFRQFERATGEDPENADAWNNAGLALAELKRTLESETSLRRAVELAPENPDFHVNLAIEMLENGKRGEAREQFEQALRLRPYDVEAQRRLRSLNSKR